MNIDAALGGVDRWALSHAAHHRLITETLNSQGNDLDFFVLDPFDVANPSQWLFDHQRWHDNINAILRVTSNDLQEVDFNNVLQRHSWLDLNFAEHQQWSRVLGV